MTFFIRMYDFFFYTYVIRDEQYYIPISRYIDCKIVIVNYHAHFYTPIRDFTAVV